MDFKKTMAEMLEATGGFLKYLIGSGWLMVTISKILVAMGGMLEPIGGNGEWLVNGNG